MSAFNLEHEQRRLGERGLTQAAAVQSAKDSISTYLFERNKMPSPFGLEARGEKVEAVGYEHRGDLAVSFQKSVDEAKTTAIEKRYQLENKGYEEAKKMFFAVPLHSTVLLLSPPPEKPIPGYPGHSMAYFYHILPGESSDKRTIKALSWVHDFSKEEQASLLQHLGAKDIKPTEESILLHPVAASDFARDTGSFHLLWDTIGAFHARKERTFSCLPGKFMEDLLLYGQEIWDKRYPEIASMRNNLAERVVAGETQQQIGKDWDIMLNLAEIELSHVDISRRLLSEPTLQDFSVSTPRGRTVFDSHRHLSYQPTMIDTSCGSSGGMGKYGSVTTATYEVSKGTNFSDSGERTLHCKSCPLCGASDITATIANGKITCPICEGSAPYAC